MCLIKEYEKIAISNTRLPDYNIFIFIFIFLKGLGHIPITPLPGPAPDCYVLWGLFTVEERTVAYRY